MDLIQRSGGFLTLNARPGEELMTALQKFADEHGINAAHIAGLGAAKRLVLAYYNLETKEYEKREFADDVEILSLNGNIGRKDSGEMIVHIHGTFGRRDFSVFGGHVCECVVSGAGEIHLTIPDSGRIMRSYDEQTGLTLMCPMLEM